MADKSSVEISGDYEDLEASLAESEALFDGFSQHVTASAEKADSVWKKVGDSLREVFSQVAAAWEAFTTLVNNQLDELWANIKKGTQDFIAASAEITRLGLNIKAMGFNVGYTLRGLEQMNDELKSMSVNGKDAIRSAQMALLEFKNVRGDIFKDAIKSAMDFAAVTGSTLSSAVLKYGELLNDPTEGLIKLAESGVKFSREQIKMIAAMEKSNDVMGLQRMILEKLGEQYDEAAFAQANSLAGSLQRLDNIFQEIYQSIGSMLAPTLTNKLIPIMEKVARVVQFLADEFNEAGDLMGDAFDKVIEVAEEWGEKLLDIGVTVFAFFQTAIQNWELTWKTAWLGMQFAAFTAMAYVLEKIGELGEFLSKTWDRVMATVAPFVDMVKAAFDVVVDIATSAWDAIMEAGAWVWENIGKKVLDWVAVTVGAVTFVSVFIALAFKAATTLAGVLWDINKAISTYVKAIWEVIMFIPNTVTSVVLGAMRMITEAISSVVGVAKEFFIALGEMAGLPFRTIDEYLREFFNSGSSVFKGMLDVVLGFFGGMSDGAGSVFGEIFDYLKVLGFNVMGMVGDKIKNVMQPAFDAIDKAKAKFGEAKDKAIEAGDAIRKKFTDAFAGFGMPDIGKVIADLKDKAKDLGGDFDKAFDQFKDKFKDNLGVDNDKLEEWREKLRDLMNFGPGGAETDEPRDPFDFGKKKKKDREGGGGGGGIEDLMALNRRIQGAAARSPEVDAINKQSDLMKALSDAEQKKGDQIIAAIGKNGFARGPQLEKFQLFNDGR